MDCIFCKIISGEMSVEKHYEDEDVIVISDINPQAKYHYLIIPKEHYPSLLEADESSLKVVARILEKVRRMNLPGLQNDFRLIINTGSGAGQSVFHLHIHILVDPFML